MASSTGSLTELPGTRPCGKKPDPELVEGSGQQEMS